MAKRHKIFDIFKVARDVNYFLLEKTTYYIAFLKDKSLGNFLGSSFTV